MSMYIIN